MIDSLSNQQFNNGSTVTKTGAMPMSNKFDGPASLVTTNPSVSSEDKPR